MKGLSRCSHAPVCYVHHGLAASLQTFDLSFSKTDLAPTQRLGDTQQDVKHETGYRIIFLCLLW